MPLQTADRMRSYDFRPQASAAGAMLAGYAQARKRGRDVQSARRPDDASASLRSNAGGFLSPGAPLHGEAARARLEPPASVRLACNGRFRLCGGPTREAAALENRPELGDGPAVNWGESARGAERGGITPPPLPLAAPRAETRALPFARGTSPPRASPNLGLFR